MGVRLSFASAAIAVAAATAVAQEAAPVSLDLESDETVPVTEKQAVLARARALDVYRLRVRYVKVEGRWAEHVNLPLTAGEILTPEKLSAAMNALRAAITAPAGGTVALRSKGEVGVLYLDVKFDSGPEIDANGNARSAPETVGVIFRPHYVQISLVEIGDNVLPIPRTSRPTFREYAPVWLRALNPTVGASVDRAFGTAVSLGGAIDWAGLSGNADERAHFDLKAEATKSLEESFYRAAAGVRASVPRSNSVLRELSFAADFAGSEEPQSGNEHTHYDGRVALGAKLKIAPNVRLALDVGCRRTDDRLTASFSALDAAANQQVSRVLLDVIPPGIYGFLRAAVWQESAWQTTGAGDSYQRIVGRIGYEKEISIAPNQTIGIELVAGAGYASGATPAFAQFFGGNPPGQFLYDGSDAATLRNMPAGPILRSFGQNEARLSGDGPFAGGGNTFWHVNLNVTIPIWSWSRSLIPNEMTDVEDAQGRPVSIKQMLKQQINVTGPSMLRAVLKNEGLSDDEADRQARNVFKEVTPATRFIIEDANLYSLKPLLMFDAAGLSDRNGRSETWLAAGGGLQLTIVTAKLEAGYVHTLSGPQQGHGGNAFVRLVFQNLF